jgi:hypothetical protein
MSTSTSFTFDILFNVTYDEPGSMSLSGRRYNLSLCKTEWEIEFLGDFTFPGCEGASALEQRGSPLDLEFEDSSVTPIRTFTSISIRQFPSQFRPAIYSVVRSPTDVEDGQSNARDIWGRVTALQRQNAFSMWVCPISGRVTWIPAPNTSGYVPGLINIDSYFS